MGECDRVNETRNGVIQRMAKNAQKMHPVANKPSRMHIQSKKIRNHWTVLNPYETQGGKKKLESTRTPTNSTNNDSGEMDKYLGRIHNRNNTTKQHMGVEKPKSSKKTKYIK